MAGPPEREIDVSSNWTDVLRVKNPDTDKAKQILCAIIDAAGGEFASTTRLYKAFYAAHLIHWQNQPGVLSKYPIARMPNGPGIDAGARLLREMADEGLIEIGSEASGPFQEATYKAVHGKADEAEPLTEGERRAVQTAVTWVQNRSASELSDLTHVHSRSWANAEDGDILDIYEDALDDEEALRNKKCNAEAEDLLSQIFKS